MKIIFIYNGAENLGIQYISSILKNKGHDVQLLFDPAVFSGDYTLLSNKFIAKAFNVDDEIVKRIASSNPDIVAFSTFSGNYRWCLNIAQNIRNLTSAKIVFGGVHTTAVPERVMAKDVIDYAIIGEGEEAILDLVKHIEDGAEDAALAEVPNLCFRNNGDIRINPPRPYIRDLDAIPFPDKQLFYDKVPLLEEKYLITTSRGCPYSCTYCSNDMYHKLYCNDKQHVRRRSPGNVIEELVHIKKRGRARLISFCDDVFTFSQKWLEEFTEMYKSRINLPFFCSVHPLSITAEKAKLLKEGGCVLTTMGVQSGSDRIRKEIFKRYSSNEKILESISHIKDAGIKISVDNIFGAPTETEEDLKESYELYKKAKTDRILTFWLAYWPKTSITQLARDYNLLTDKDVDNIEEGNIGFIHDTGSVNREKVDMYGTYEIMFQLRSLIHNDELYSKMTKAIVHMPFKKITSKAIMFLIALKNRDFKALFLLKYILAKKNTP